MAEANEAEYKALKELADAAHDFGIKWKPRNRITGAYANAIDRLVQTARHYAVRSDEAWAAEVGELRDALRKAHDSNGQVCKCALCARE